MMTNSKKIEVLKLVKSEHKGLIEIGYETGLCLASMRLVLKNEIDSADQKYVTNLVKREILLKGFCYSGRGEKIPLYKNLQLSGYIWPRKDTQSRIDFLDSEIKKLKNKPTWKRLVEYLRKEK